MKPTKRVEAGGNVQLSGFRDLEEGELSAAEKILSHYERRFTELCGEGMRLKVTLKKVHATAKSEKYELHAFVEAPGYHFEASLIERSVFVGLDRVLKKIENGIRK